MCLGISVNRLFEKHLDISQSMQSLNFGVRLYWSISTKRKRGVINIEHW